MSTLAVFRSGGLHWTLGPPPERDRFNMLQIPLWTVQSGGSGPQTVRRRSATAQHRPTTTNSVSAGQSANRRDTARSRHAVATLRLTGQLVLYNVLAEPGLPRLDRPSTLGLGG